MSPDFTFNYVDNETLNEYGPTLFGAGLTNRPVIKNMEPVIQLSEELNMDLEQKVLELEGIINQLKAELEKLKSRSEDDSAMMEAIKEKEQKEGDQVADAQLRIFLIKEEQHL